MSAVAGTGPVIFVALAVPESVSAEGATEKAAASPVFLTIIDTVIVWPEKSMAGAAEIVVVNSGAVIIVNAGDCAELVDVDTAELFAVPVAEPVR